MVFRDWCEACRAYTPHQGVADMRQPAIALGGVCLQCGQAHDAR